ncbi:MAG: MFS transporter [Chthonomonas sp.]|nr:MFS transporter [Chthonomonas sp.]
MPALIAIFLTVLIDMLSFGMAIPDLQLRGESLGAHGPLLGLMLASFSIAQLLTAPFLGHWSDLVGRRKVLLVTCAMTALCFLLYSQAHSLPVMFASRILAGISGANLGVAFAYIADVTKPEDRGKGMGLVGAAFGIGFIMGPPVGAALVEMGKGGPFVLGMTAMALALVNLFFIWRFIPNTKPADPPKAKGNPLLANWRNVMTALQVPSLSVLVYLFFGSTFAFSNLESTYFLLLSHQWNMPMREGAWVLAWVGIVSAFMQGYFIAKLIPKFGEPTLMRVGYLAQVPILLLVPFTPPWVPMLFGCLLLGIATGICSPSTSSMISRTAPPNMQGSIFGVTQSVGALGRVLGPLCGSTLFAKGPAYPYYLAALVMLIPATLSWRVKMPGEEGMA